MRKCSGQRNLCEKGLQQLADGRCDGLLVDQRPPPLSVFCSPLLLVRAERLMQKQRSAMEQSIPGWRLRNRELVCDMLLPCALCTVICCSYPHAADAADADARPPTAINTLPPAPIPASYVTNKHRALQ